MGLIKSRVFSPIFCTRNCIELSSEPTTSHGNYNIIITLKNYSLDESKKLNQFCVERGLSDSSKRKYKICLKRYVNFYDMTLEELIEEADTEEETIARENKRKIRF